MTVNLLTEDQARSMAVESGKQALAMFIEAFMPDFNKPAQPLADEEHFTPKELAKYLKCHVETIRLKKRNGELPFHQHGRKIIFKKSEIDALTANPVFKSGL